MTQARKTRPSDLPTKRVVASDGSVIQMKVVQAESPTLGADLLAAFRSNVRRIREDRRDRQRAAQNPS
ncbi:hypothetical protein BH11PSE6_BH11PSE6_19250 [soil metagenome]|jgi:hypothetical protein